MQSTGTSHLKEWKAIWENELGRQVKQFCPDGVGEYTSKNCAEYLKSEGIIEETTALYSLQSNRDVERVNHTIMERVGCMLDEAGLSNK